MTLTQITEKGIKDGEIINADINASAAIARTKLANVDLVDDTSPQLGGDLQSNGSDIDFADNDKARFGASADLEIYHDNANSRSFVLSNTNNELRILQAGNAGMLIQNQNSFNLEIKTNAKDAIKCIANNSVELYYDGSKKFETTSTGIALTGSVHTVNSGNFYPSLDNNIQLGLSNKKWSTINGVSLNINGGNAEFRGTTPGTTDMTWVQSENALNFDDNVYAHFGNGDDLKIYHDGSHSYIADTGTGNLNITASTVNINNAANSENIARFIENGAVELYYDNSKKFETTADGVDVQGHITLAASNNAPKITFDENGANDPKAEIQMDQVDGSNGHLIFKTEGSGTLSERMRLNSSGQVAIGTTSPGDANLAIKGTTNAYGGIGNSTTLVGAKLILEDDQGRKVSFWAPRTGEGAIGSITNHDFVVVTSNAEKARFSHSTGNFSLASGNLVFGTSGKGIDFSATSDASGKTSELLDDYEEGSWAATSLNYDYDSNQAQRGHYIKIGRLVHAFFRVKFHNQSTYVGNHLVFNGLPFTAASGNPYDSNVGGFAPGYGSVDFFRIFVSPGSKNAYWYTGTGSAFNNNTGLNGADIRGCIVYTASA